jgi:hypothetical protein
VNTPVPFFLNRRKSTIFSGVASPRETFSVFNSFSYDTPFGKNRVGRMVSQATVEYK